MKKAFTKVKKQRLNSVSGDQDYTLKKKRFPNGYNGRKVLHELSRKWVRFGIADTPNEAMKMLLGGMQK